jgi:hypothetical protein
MMNFLSPILTIRFDATSKSILIYHPDKSQFPDPLVTIREETYSAMTFEEAAEFVGSRILLLIPGMREQFKDELARLASSETGKGFRGKPEK